MNTKTLSLKKPVQKPAQQSARPEKSLINKSVRLQTKSKHVLIGIVVSFDSGWLILDGCEHHWQPDGTLSGPMSKGRYTLDRSTIQFIAEVDHD